MLSQFTSFRIDMKPNDDNDIIESESLLTDEESPNSEKKINIDDKDKEIKPEGNKIANCLSRNAILIFCFVGLQVSYVTWGVTQEQLMNQEYKHGRFKSAAFCVFGNRFLALFVSLGIVLWKRATSVKPVSEAPYYYYAPSAISNSISSWSQYECLKYISFPTQVLSKSCKIIPVMLVGIVLNKKSYPWLDYAEALLIAAGVAAFTFAEKSGGGDGDQGNDTMFGTLLLATYLVADSFTSQWQSKVFKAYEIDQFQMMLGTNIWATIIVGAQLLQSGDGITSIAFLLAEPKAMLHMILLSITSATGQLFIFYTIKEFGPVIFTIMMTTRQIFSLFLSCMLFNHPLHAMGWFGSMLVFAVVFYRIYRKGTD